MSYNNAQHDRLIANLVRYGRVQAVDAAAGEATVDFDGEVVPGLSWAKRRAGKTREWYAPSEGEQVCVLSPSGELSQGTIAYSIEQDEFPNPGNSSDQDLTEYPDGTVVEYNSASHTLTIDASVSSGTVIIKCNTATVEAAASVTIDTPETTCTGNLTVAKSLNVGAGGGSATIEGNVAFTGGSVTHNGKNIGDTHQHSGVQPGGGNTEAPT